MSEMRRGMWRRASRMLAVMTAIAMLLSITPVYADIPGGRSDNIAAGRAAMPNPGTQEQDLPNITAPAPYNVFEFVVTCMACHGGTIDQQVGHGGNWAGTNMASSARDPIFRANAQIVNGAIDGASNLCFRCHSPNGWYSGRYNRALAGEPDGSLQEHSPLLSTDDEGIMCEFCHRAIGNVVMNEIDGQPSDDAAFNMMTGVFDWPHTGDPYPQGPAPGNPMGDNTMQLNDGMTYGGKYAGSVEVTFSDVPMDGTPYTGQTYGIFPAGWDTWLPGPIPSPIEIAGRRVAWGPDGSVATHFEDPADVPRTPGGAKDYYAQAISLEHPTYKSDFIQSSEFCGTCHDLSVPIAPGMPEQRTYTEWLYSAYGDEGSADFARCQDCHMPSIKHEYSDDATLTLNVDPTLAGFFPYGKDRGPQGGTAMHKLTGSNRDLPQMMQMLYPEVDLEVIGAPTGNDTRVFPGMMSDRSLTWDRAERNTEVMLSEAVTADIVQPPTYDAGEGRWSMQVRVVNHTGHSVPSGYPDGRRMYLSVGVTDATDTTVYESGVWDPDTAWLMTDGATDFKRATGNVIDSTDNRIMTYERVTGSPVASGSPVFEESESLLNPQILLDTRIPPKGFDYAQYEAAGVKFWTYEETTTPEAGVIPSEDPTRFTSNEDIVTYWFDAPSDAELTADVAVQYQSHSREFMEHLRVNQPANGPRPEGPPDVYDPNYPLTPNYLSDVINLESYQALDGSALNDDWGGIAYAAWLGTGKGEPYTMSLVSTVETAAPDAPINVAATPVDPFTNNVTWDAVDGATSYEVWTRYGANDEWAAWDKLAIVPASATPAFENGGLNVSKTYAYKIVAVNGAGKSPDSQIVTITTATDLPLMPEALKMVTSTGNPTPSITMSWINMADNQDGFIVQRQAVPPVGPFVEVARFADAAAAGNAVTWTDTAVQAGSSYNYRVASYNVQGESVFTPPVMMWTPGTPGDVGALNATAVSQTRVDLDWTAATGQVTDYKIERSDDGGATWGQIGTVVAPNLSFIDYTVTAGNQYSYRVWAMNGASTSLNPSPTATVTTPISPPAAPTNFTATGVWLPAPDDVPAVDLAWVDASTNEDGFEIERSDDGGATWSLIAERAANTTGYRDLTVVAKSTYLYRIRAFAIDGTRVYSPYAGPATAVTPGEAPQAPENLNARALYTSVMVMWQDKSNNELGFEVWRSTDGTNFSLLAMTGPNERRYIDTVLTPNTTYWYQVRAYNTDGFSAFAGPAEVRYVGPRTRGSSGRRVMPK